jgi:hypothetical protein
MPKFRLHFKLKCKGNKKKRHNVIGDLHKKKVLNIISSTFGSGITLTEITKKTRFTRQAVHPFLKELVKEAKIFKAQNRYYLEKYFSDDWTIFGEYLGFILGGKDFRKMKLDHISKIDLEQIFANRDDNIEKAIFEFANRIGPFMVYLLIELMRPTNTLLPINMREEKALDFVKSALPLDYLLRSFLFSLPPSFNEAMHFGVQMKQEKLEKLTNAYKKVYPSFHKYMEAGYLNHFKNIFLNVEENYSSCKHEWRQVSIHKIGTFYECNRCYAIVKPSEISATPPN